MAFLRVVDFLAAGFLRVAVFFRVVAFFRVVDFLAAGFLRVAVFFRVVAFLAAGFLAAVFFRVVAFLRVALLVRAAALLFLAGIAITFLIVGNNPIQYHRGAVRYPKSGGKDRGFLFGGTGHSRVTRRSRRRRRTSLRKPPDRPSSRIGLTSLCTFWEASEDNDAGHRPEGSLSVGHGFKPVCGREVAGGSIPVRILVERTESLVGTPIPIPLPC